MIEWLGGGRPLASDRPAAGPRPRRAGAAAAIRAAFLYAMLMCAALPPATARGLGETTPVEDANAAMQLSARDAQLSETPVAGDYRIAPGDELALKFFYVPELNEVAIVRPDGRIHLQLIGEIRAADLTPEQLAAALKRAYAANLRHPEVSVEVQKGFARQQVFVGGEVARPGAQPLLPSLTVMRALIVAQGLKDTAAANRVVILRRGEDGKPQVIQVNVASQSRKGASDGNDPLLQPFDVVLAVPSRVSRLNKWIDQYVRRNLPVNVGFSYDLNDNRSGY
jgi:protein involved in polysaccharide export with SLBB domain